MLNPRVSVIVPNFNHAHYLPQRLESILNQSYQDFEIILLDDCSTDNSREIIEQYRNHQKVSHILYNERNGGTSYKQWYKGIEYANGELIWIAESDDWCDVRFLETVVPHFQDNKVSISFVNTIFVSSGDKVENTPLLTGQFFKFSGDEFIRNKMLLGNEIVNASMAVFRKQYYWEVKDNGFLKMRLCGDWLLWVQIIYKNKIVSIEDSLNFCRRHTTNTATKCSALGLDFIEGVKVLKIGKKLSNNHFNRKLIYSTWLDRYYFLKEGFSKGVLIKVFIYLLSNEPLMFCYFIYKIARARVKRIVKN